MAPGRVLGENLMADISCHIYECVSFLSSPISTCPLNYPRDELSSLSPCPNYRFGTTLKGSPSPRASGGIDRACEKVTNEFPGSGSMMHIWERPE